MSTPDPLRAEWIRAALGGTTIGSQIVVLEETASTNDVAREMATDNAPEGLVVFAEHQTAGRGQRGQRWHSAPYAGLWLSVLLRPEISPNDSVRLTTWSARTVASTIESSCGLTATIKEPNDVYVAGGKVAGVLVEMRAQRRAPHVAILGIGLNVNQRRTDFPKELHDRATSLAIATGRQHDRNELAVALLQHLDRTYALVVTRTLDR